MNFLSWVDLELKVPQRLQLVTIKNFLADYGHAVVFYGGDDILVHRELPSLLYKARAKEKNFSGICFFSLEQVLRCKARHQIIQELFLNVEFLGFALENLLYPKVRSDKLQEIVTIHSLAVQSSTDEIKQFFK